MTLASETSGHGPALCFVHGFTQTRASWQPVISHLSHSYSCTAVDAPGHGESVNGCLTLTECGNEIAAVMTPGTLIGYSMGARMALHAALQHPEKVRRLVLISGTAGIDDVEERTLRVCNDEKLAEHIRDVGLATFIDEWLGNPMFSGLDREKAQINERLRNTPEGLADSLRFAGTGTQDPLWDRLAELSIPVLIITGAEDKKFADLGMRLHQGIATSTLKVVNGAGHTVHLEQTEQCVEILQSWLRETASTE